MPATLPVTLTGNQDIDGLLESDRWAVATLSFSFPTTAAAYAADYDPAQGLDEPTTNFSAFTAGQRVAARDVLAQFASVANLTFTESTGGAAANADLRFGRTGATEVAHAYTPTSHPVGGDSWYANTGDFALVANPQVGDYDYSTLLHEVGHALGLKHGHEVYEADPPFFPARPAMTAAHDSMEFSVMTYRSYVGADLSGYTNETFGYAQSLMMYDIAALQYMYGANFSHNGGNSVYTWNPNSGEMAINGVGQGAPGGNRVFLTVWDGGGSDTYNLSAYDDGVRIDLRPGQWTTLSDVQIANLGDGNFARGNIANALQFEGDARSLIENAVGGDGNDIITGNNAVNRLTGGRGNDRLDGRGGADAMNGGTGNDTYMVDNARDRAIESSAAGGTDSVRSSVSFTLRANLDNLTLTGGGTINGNGNGLDNWLTGNGAANRLLGGAGEDMVRGGNGNDRLYGGEGDDRLSGGSGADRFYFDTALNASTNVDRILDFSTAPDTIMLDRAIFDDIALNGTLRASAFRNGNVAADSSDRILYDGATGRIFYDADGNGAGADAILFATVTAGTALTNADFSVFG